MFKNNYKSSKHSDVPGSRGSFTPPTNSMHRYYDDPHLTAEKTKACPRSHSERTGGVGFEPRPSIASRRHKQCWRRTFQLESEDAVSHTAGKCSHNLLNGLMNAFFIHEVMKISTPYLFNKNVSIRCFVLKLKKKNAFYIECIVLQSKEHSR